MCDDKLIEQWIEDDWRLGGPGGVCLKDYGIQVWAIIAHLEGIDGDAEQTAIDFVVPLEAIQAAVAYYTCSPMHRTAIDGLIMLNAVPTH